MRIAINGFGRIGRMVARQLLVQGHADLQLVAINGTGTLAQNALLLEFDSIHGRMPQTVREGDGGLSYAGRHIPVFSERDPARLNWGDLGVDLVMECTGAFNDGARASAHRDAGAGRVLISAPAVNVDRTVVYGVNHQELIATDRMVSNASCTTNCLAPVAQVLDQNLGLESGYMTTIHAVTGDQSIIDARHQDPRRGRAAYESIVPTKTGAARAIGQVLPHLAGRLSGSALRVPTANVSLVDLVFTSKNKTSVAMINDMFVAASNTPALRGVLGVNSRPLVSTDFCTDAHSAIVDLTQTEVMGEHMARVVAWYDNEWGFAARMLDTATHMGRVAGLLSADVVPHPMTFAA